MAIVKTNHGGAHPTPKPYLSPNADSNPNPHPHPNPRTSNLTLTLTLIRRWELAVPFETEYIAICADLQAFDPEPASDLAAERPSL